MSTRPRVRASTVVGTPTKEFGVRTVARLRRASVTQNERQKSMTGSIAVAGAALGGGIALGLIGMKAAEAVGRNPGASGKILVQALLSAALAEGAIIIVILMGK